MRHTEKKQIKEWIEKFNNLITEIETLKYGLNEIRDEHEEWMDERNSDTDDKFSETPTGERASEDLDVLDTACNDLEDAIDTLNDAIEPVSDLINQ